MNEDISNNQENEIQILDVQHRLEELNRWANKWLVEDRKLEMELFRLGDSRRDKQKGAQIAYLRNLLGYQIIKAPINLDKEILTKIGYETYKDGLASQFAALSKQQKIAWMNNFLFIRTSDLKSLISKCNYLANFISLGQGRNLLLGALSGMGKTTSLHWLASQNLPKVMEDHNEVSVVVAECPVNNTSPRTLYQRIITGLGKTYFVSDREEDLLNQIIMDFQKCRVKLLILDEIEHLVRHEYRRRVLEISNLTKVCIICSSCRPETFVEGDIEIAGRWNDKITLEPYLGERLIQLLALIELLLPFPASSNLYTINERSEAIDSPALFIESVTQGILRDIVRLIYDAGLKAIEMEMPNISLDLLKQTWKEIQHSPVTDLRTLILGRIKDNARS